MPLWIIDIGVWQLWLILSFSTFISIWFCMNGVIYLPPIQTPAWWLLWLVAQLLVSPIHQKKSLLVSPLQLGLVTMQFCHLGWISSSARSVFNVQSCLVSLVQSCFIFCAGYFSYTPFSCGFDGHLLLLHSLRLLNSFWRDYCVS